MQSLVAGKLRLKENERGVAIIAGQIDGLKIGDNGLEPSTSVQRFGDEIAVAAATAAAAQADGHHPQDSNNPLLVMDKQANDKLTYFTTDQVSKEENKMVVLRIK